MRPLNATPSQLPNTSGKPMLRTIMASVNQGIPVGSRAGAVLRRRGLVSGDCKLHICGGRKLHTRHLCSAKSRSGVDCAF